MTSETRTEITELIAYLNKIKGYKRETFFIAVSIVDRYLASRPRMVPWSVPLATVAVLMAAKLEQSISPSFSRMISLLPTAYKGKVSKQQLIDLEFEVISTLQWDVQHAAPTLFAERHLKVMGLQSGDLQSAVVQLAN